MARGAAIPTEAEVLRESSLLPGCERRSPFAHPQKLDGFISRDFEQEEGVAETGTLSRRAAVGGHPPADFFSSKRGLPLRLQCQIPRSLEKADPDGMA